MDINVTVFQEPRGVMRIFQFIFSICAFATTCNFTGFIDFKCAQEFKFIYEYPFNLVLNKHALNPGNMTAPCHPTVSVFGDFSSDARFFVATGVVAMLYCLVIMIIYTKFDQLYKTNTHIPLIDFLLSVFIAVLWLSSSASWANALTGLKHVTDPTHIIWDNAMNNCACPVAIGSFQSLNISVVPAYNIGLLYGRQNRFWDSSTSFCGQPICGSCIKKRFGSKTQGLRLLQEYKLYHRSVSTKHKTPIKPAQNPPQQ